MIESSEAAGSVLLPFLVNGAFTAVVEGYSQYDDISCVSLLNEGI